MFDWEGVNTALASESLTEGLFRLEQFARSNGNEELANWAETELEGYKLADYPIEEIPDYRQVPATVTTHGLSISVKGERIALQDGIANIEKYAKGLAFYDTGPTDETVFTEFDPVTLKTLFLKVRIQARRRFLQAFPIKPASQTPILANSLPNRKLDSTQRRYLHEALLDAFPKWGELERLLSLGLDENLATLARNTNLSDAVFDLIQWAESQNRVKDLIDAAVKANPQHTMLLVIQAFYK